MSELVQHRLAVKARVGALVVDVALELRAPWTVLFGPSGCGKTSVLRAMGGVLEGAEVSFARRTGGGDWGSLEKLAPDCRRLAYAPQSGAVFPHLSVRENVGFAYAVCKDPPKEAAIVDEALSLFRLHAICSRMPRELSGGERQRVNLARAFAAPGACLMMLDEPFAGLDRGLRDALLPGMMAWCVARGLQVVSVTHDVDEALLLGAEVVRMEAGKVVAQGVAADVLAEERARMVRSLG
jgi:molybdate transport system ATP-binding protein